MNAGSGGARILFRCDASNQIGGGHAMRCLTLANALSEAGAAVTFVAAAMPEAIAERIDDGGHRLVRIPASPELQRPDGKWEEPPLDDDSQLVDAKATSEAIDHVDWLVVDHYLLDARWHSAARSFAGQILVIDDLANRSYDCDILLDQNFGRSAEDYRDRIPSGAKVLAGPAFALLRPEFARERPAALERRQAGGPVRRILISMGTTDPGGITARVVGQVLEAAPDCAIDVVLGPQASSLPDVRELEDRQPGLSIHVDSERMAELMRDADIAIGAAGTTSWERSCLGLPTIVFVMAENQRLAATNLERAGANVLAGSPEAIPALLGRIADDERLLLSMIAASAAVTDGNGVGRMVEAMIGPTLQRDRELTLRPVRPEDIRITWLWRNDHVTRAFSQTTAPILWPDHEAWWHNALDSDVRQLLIAELAGAPVAAVRFDEIEDGHEVSINLAPSARGEGLGGCILAKACSGFREQHSASRLWAIIHRGNPASRRIFEKVGFVHTEALSNSPFERYVLAEGMAT